MIQISNISLSYPGENGSIRQVLQGINLSVAEGESVAIMGPNGSGKTTLALCLNGLLIPTEGFVTVDGSSTGDVKNLGTIRRKVGMVFQNPDNQIVSATVEREIAFGLENIGMPYEEMHAVVEEMLEKFDLGKYRHRSPHYLSGGEKQKLALAAVLAMRPKYLVLDEPTSLLDPQSRTEILEIVRQMHKQHNGSFQPAITTILITQFPEEALVADRLIVLNDRGIAMDETPDAIFSQTKALQDIGLEPPISYRVQELLAGYLEREKVVF